MTSKLIPIIFVFLLTLGCGRHKETKGTPATLDEMNRAVEAVVMRNGGAFPPDTNQVANFLTLWGKTMLVVPPGKTLMLDSGKRQYVLVDQ
jgi:hypothetical protein